jgi:Co/Zn/Cd efflux system component
MNKLSPGALVIFVVCVVLSIVAQQRFFDFDGVTGVFVAAVIGAVGGLIGAAIGLALFPRKGYQHD